MSSFLTNLLTSIHKFLTFPFFTVPPNQPISDPPPDSHYPLTNASSSTLTLPDGRKLGYAQFGSPTGHPLLYCHGFPGARLEAAIFHDVGRELGVRIIAADRPGFGWSDPQPGRTVLDWPKDLEALAKHLDLPEYSVMGISGGGPYALASAFALPKAKLRSVTIICGLGPPDIGMRGARLPNWLGFTSKFKHTPVFLLRWFFQLDVIARLDLPDEERLERFLAQSRSMTSAKDKKIFSDVDIARMMLRNAREAYSQGFYFAREDGRVMCRDPGFRVEDIRKDLKISLWYGTDDVFVPCNHGIQIKKRLGDGEASRLRVLEETHASLVFGKEREVIEDILGML